MDSLSDAALAKRLDLVKQQQSMAAKQGKEAALQNLQEHEDAIVQARLRKPVRRRTAKEYIGLPVVRKEADACLLYDVTAKEIMEYAPGVQWSLAKSKALRERGTGNKVVYLGFPTEPKTGE